MNVQPIAKPGANAEQTQAPSPQAQSARERAIALLTNGAAPQPASADEIVNPSQGQEVKDVPSVETAAPPVKAETKTEEPPLSTQYAILARKEKQLRAKAQAQEAAFKAKEAELAAREQQYKSKDEEYNTKYVPKDRINQDLMTVLAENGITYDQITQMVLNQPQQDPQTKAYLSRLEAKIADLEGQVTGTKKSFEDQQTASYQQAVNQIRTEVKQLVYTDPQFEMTKHTNSVDDVVELIEKTFNEDGRLMTPEEAAIEIEEYLTDRAVKLAQVDKIQKKLQPPKQAPKATETKQGEKPQQQTLKTLTNAVSTTRKLSSRERAIAAFKGELKN